MATIKIAYASPVTITISLASLATSSTFVAGRESTQIDNSTNLYVDAIVKGKVTVGTTPTANTEIRVYVWGSNISLATTPIDVLDGTDSAETIVNTGVLNSGLRLARIGTVLVNTSNIAYELAQFSVAEQFGGIMPKFWGLYVAHNTGVNLNATAGNHIFEYEGITYTST